MLVVFALIDIPLLQKKRWVGEKGKVGVGGEKKKGSTNKKWSSLCDMFCVLTNIKRFQEFGVI